MVLNERRALMDASTPTVETIHVGDGLNNLYFDWGWHGCGFGQLHIYNDGSEIRCANENMSRESVRKLLHALADKIADDVMMDDE